MKDRRLTSPTLPGHIELISEGISFTSAMRNMLAHAAFFGNFTSADVNSMSTYMHAYRVNQGATIFQQGEENGYLCILAEGSISAHRKDELGNHHQLATIQPGRTFGETSLVDDLPYSASLIADTKCTLLIMSRENFRRCIDRNPALGVRILRQIALRLSLRLRQASEQLAEYLG